MTYNSSQAFEVIVPTLYDLDKKEKIFLVTYTGKAKEHVLPSD
jgi:hypothetical protein